MNEKSCEILRSFADKLEKGEQVCFLFVSLVGEGTQTVITGSLEQMDHMVMMMHRHVEKYAQTLQTVHFLSNDSKGAPS